MKSKKPRRHRITFKEREAGKPINVRRKKSISAQCTSRPNPIVTRLIGVKSGDVDIPPKLWPNREGQRQVILESVQQTTIGPGIAHIVPADDPMCRTYPVSATMLPTKAIEQYRQRKKSRQSRL